MVIDNLLCIVLLQDTTILRSYNAHNDYVLSLTSFNCLHDEFYNKQVYDMLDELQVSVFSFKKYVINLAIPSWQYGAYDHQMISTMS